jgi:hypothetical protein
VSWGKHLETGSLIQQGIDLEVAGKHKEAIIRFNEVLNSEALVLEQAIALFFKGCALEKSGRTDEMIGCHLHLVELDLEEQDVETIVYIYRKTLKQNPPRRIRFLASDIPRKAPEQKREVRNIEAKAISSKTKIVDLERNMGNLTIVAKVVRKSRGTSRGKNKLGFAVIEDETGIIKLNLCGKQVEQVRLGRQIKISGAFTEVNDDCLEIWTWKDLELLPKS